jgi:ATP-dependent Lon protease
MAPRRPLEPLRPEDLAWKCDPESVRLVPGEEAGPFETVIGQRRALDALRLGLELYARGYNVFVCGISGTGRTSTIQQILEGISPRCALPDDCAYVHNFREPHRPSLLRLPRGRTRVFAREVRELLERLRASIPALLESESHLDRRKALLDRFEKRERDLYRFFEERAREERFSLVQVQLGPLARPDLYYVVEGKAVPVDHLRGLREQGKIPDVDVEAVERRYEELSAEIAGLLRRGRAIAREMEEAIRDLERDEVLGLVRGHFEDLRERWNHPAVTRFVEGAQGFVLDHLEAFRESPDGEKPRGANVLERVFDVNILLDHTGRDGCAVEIENHPTYANLFGTVELVPSRSGTPRADHTGIRPGSLLAADGGYLVVNALDVLLQPGVWPALKRTLKSGFLEIHPPEGVIPFAPVALKPEPIPINVKVVMIGEASLYHLLYAIDEDFAKVFKVKAEFDSEMPRTEENVRLYGAFAARQAAKEGLKPCTADGVAALVEHGVRLAEKREKLTARFGRLADLLREASYWATSEESEAIDRPHVERAIRESKRRENLPEEKIRELVTSGTILLDLDGERVGVVNGLAVFDMGPYAFGTPTRITASVGLGRAGIINIEREARLSGATHDKGLLILAGFIRERFARRVPLALSASLCFEQAYGGIEGDSASSAEAYALLSALSGVPVRQGIAVTGSVNQKGEIQPIGGVNEKVEGFFATCAATGLTGRQGVLVPRRNLQNLMLEGEVVRAVREGKFRIWAVETVDEGIEILTGEPAESVNGKVEEKLEEFAERLRRFERPVEEEAPR